MKFKNGVAGLIVKNVRLVAHISGSQSIIIDQNEINDAIEDLKKVVGHVKIVNIHIKYTNLESKTVNCNSVDKAIAWLNLNDTKEK